MTSTPEPDGLVLATKQLADNVERLAARLTIVDDQAKEARATARRSRALTKWAVGIAAVALIAAGMSFVALDKIQAAQVVNCQNANKTRLAQTSLWFFLFDASFEQNPNLEPAQRKFLTDTKAWVKELFQPHDCNDLARKYPIPRRPAIPAPTE